MTDQVLLKRIDEIERDVSARLLEIVGRNAEWFAGKLGLATSTFSHELENDPRNRLKLRGLLAVALLSEQHHAVMEPINTPLRLATLPVPCTQDSTESAQVLCIRAAKELGDVLRVVLGAIQPDSPGGVKFTKVEVAEVRQELADVWRVLGQLEQRAEDDENG